ncbi:RUN domain-containing protein 3B [Octopus bimaculoides]|uniref:RUN domain-containing protein n=1 Tax=Octopus bimaculoides TaxID=37653 RepID=A0A0L8I840_OCTBM|nr:RUN domain-containing protein 3B [Octopus bimaculoides]|eukprot:XP_014787793.1 PREDICTED: RUN domain-containing protein 3B-like [Octopus bimaculoides]
MDIAASSRRKALAIRQWTVQRKNLVNICRLAVKSLIDMASLDIIDDDCEELINLLAILEQILMHRLRPHKTWYGSEGTRPFWDYIRVACQGVAHNCIESINTIENIRSPHAKGQAWLRVVLMEKRLSEYLSEALKQTRITKNFYQEGAVMLSDDAKMLCDTLLGMNAIDFSFCLKGENIELLGPIAVDYTPYLQYFSSSESIEADLRDFTNSNSSSSLLNAENLNEDSWRMKYYKLEANYKIIHEQKGYFEELVRLREDQLHEIHKQYEKHVETLRSMESDGIRERCQLESVIIELQGQLSAMKDYSHSLQQELLFLMSRQQMMPLSTAMEPISTQKEHCSELDNDPSSYASPECISVLSHSSQHHNSDISNQSSLTVPLYKSQKKEDSQSLVPLAGSFSSEASMKMIDNQCVAGPTDGSPTMDSDSEPPSSAASEMTRQHQLMMFRSPKEKSDKNKTGNTNITVSPPGTKAKVEANNSNDTAKPDLVAFCDPADNGNAIASTLSANDTTDSLNNDCTPKNEEIPLEKEPENTSAPCPQRVLPNLSDDVEKNSEHLESNAGHSDSESSSWSDVGLVQDSADSDSNGVHNIKKDSSKKTPINRAF